MQARVDSTESAYPETRYRTGRNSAPQHCSSVWQPRELHVGARRIAGLRQRMYLCHSCAQHITYYVQGNISLISDIGQVTRKSVSMRLSAHKLSVRARL